jgi:hypothetical protein
MNLPSFRTIRQMFPVAVTLHNGEEAIFMPGWISTHSNQLRLQPRPGSIWFGLLLATLAAWAVTVLSTRKGKESVWTYLLFGGAATMLINVFVPHIPATLLFEQYTPGIVTAVLLNLPVMSILLYKAVEDHWVSGRSAVRYAVLVPIFIAVSIVGLFTLA